jgi:DNA-binding NarL/FixJ family response regulator
MAHLTYAQRAPRHSRIRAVFFAEDTALHAELAALAADLSPDVDIYCATNEFDFVGRVRESAPDVVLLSGARHRLWRLVGGADEQPSLRLLLVVERQEADGIAQLSADGYLVRQDLSADGLRRALHQLAADELAIPRELGRTLIRQAAVSVAPKRRATLTVRENEALLLLVSGLSNKQIGRRMRISEHGAKRLVSSILNKLDATNRTSAVVTAIKTGLVDEAALAGAGH